MVIKSKYKKYNLGISIAAFEEDLKYVEMERYENKSA